MTPEHPEVTLHADESEIRLNDPDKVQVYTSRGHWGTLKEVLEKAESRERTTSAAVSLIQDLIDLNRSIERLITVSTKNLENARRAQIDNGHEPVPATSPEETTAEV